MDLQKLEESTKMLLMELYEIRKQLRLFEEKAHQDHEQTQRLHVDINAFRQQLVNIQERISFQQETIAGLYDRCNELILANQQMREINNQLTQSFFTTQMFPQISIRASPNKNIQESFQLSSDLIRSIENIIQDNPEPLPSSVSMTSDSTELFQDFSFPSSGFSYQVQADENQRKAVNQSTQPLQVQEQPVTMASKLKQAIANSEPKTVDSHLLRLYVGNLKVTTKEKSLREYFSKFGTVSDVFFPGDVKNGHRGFAYVTFQSFVGKHPLDIKQHVIDGSVVYLDISSNTKGKNEPSQVLLISGIIQDIKTDEIIKYFRKFGRVLDVIRTRENNKFSRWAFVKFKNADSVEKAMADPLHEISGQLIDCRKAKHWKSSEEKAEEGNEGGVKKLVIHGLSPKTKSETIEKYFSKYTKVLDHYIPTHYGTNASKGFGYIVVASEDAAFEYKGHVIDGQPVKVTVDASHRASGKSSTLLVSGGPKIMRQIEEVDLKNFFKKFGAIKSVRKPKDPGSQNGAHYAFVEFNSSEAVEKALKSMSYKINGQIVCVTKARTDQFKKNPGHKNP